MVETIDGLALAETIGAEVRASIAAMDGYRPGLAVVLVGSDPASQIYVRMKEKAAAIVGIRSIRHDFPFRRYRSGPDGAARPVQRSGGHRRDPRSTPLPRHINATQVLDRIRHDKDVDGFHPVNVGRLSTGSDGLVPCTPFGCIRLLETRISDFRGLHAVVIGKSNIVGKPVSLLLLEKECTVTVAHIETRGLPDIVRTAASCMTPSWITKSRWSNC